MLATSDGGTFSKGTSITDSDVLKVFKLEQSTRLIGLKGIGDATSLDSLGLILLDTSCDPTVIAENEEGEGGQEVDDISEIETVVDEQSEQTNTEETKVEISVDETEVQVTFTSKTKEIVLSSESLIGEDKLSNSDTFLIGSVVGGSLCAIVVLLFLYCCCCRKKKNDAELSQKIFATKPGSKSSNYTPVKIEAKQDLIAPEGGATKIKRAKTQMFRPFTLTG